ncbi:relaxase/mobilization nuclease domain-containing protein [Streptomyces sp. NPDC056909]|uniref:relaxase/mobilization nuclease domain-containing protein n=1 Tax=Streptomyces sp. NPDC056909 TaxID=3345963 RepID=UPI0036B98462
MIANIVKPGRSTRGVINYLYGPGRANEHTDPHLVASWDGFAPDPGRSADENAARAQLAKAMDLRVKQAGDRAPDGHVWHCSVRAAPTDRVLTDTEWAALARRVVSAAGIAPEGDPDGCRWIAVRHADDHIHIVATKVRGDLTPARNWNDYRRVNKELIAIETELGLFQVERGDRTAAKRPTRAEKEKATRTGRQRTAREHLRSTARTMVAIAITPEEFLYLLSHTEGVLTEVQYFPSGGIRGYKIALEGDTNAAGQPIWFSGSTLAPDLSFPQVRERLTATAPQATPQTGDRHRPNPWHQATAAAERIPHHLDQADDPAAQAHLAAFGEALDALPLIAPAAIRPQLRQAADAFERATRSRIHADHHHARALRGAVRAMLRQPTTGDGTGLAMLLDAAVLVVMAAIRWHDLRHHDQQVIAARQTLNYLQAAYQHAAAAPLALIAQHRPPAHTITRHAQHIRAYVPEHAEEILTDPHWASLAATLTNAEAAGHTAERLLQQAVDERALDDARSPAQVLTWRIHRLTQRPVPSARARAAQARTTTAATRTTEPVHSELPAPPRADPTKAANQRR